VKLCDKVKMKEVFELKKGVALVDNDVASKLLLYSLGRDKVSN
jgi:hypothetical protein